MGEFILKFAHWATEATVSELVIVLLLFIILGLVLWIVRVNKFKFFLFSKSKSISTSEVIDSLGISNKEILELIHSHNNHFNSFSVETLEKLNNILRILSEKDTKELNEYIIQISLASFICNMFSAYIYTFIYKTPMNKERAIKIYIEKMQTKYNELVSDLVNIMFKTYVEVYSKEHSKKIATISLAQYLSKSIKVKEVFEENLTLLLGNGTLSWEDITNIFKNIERNIKQIIFNALYTGVFIEELSESPTFDLTIMLSNGKEIGTSVYGKTTD